MAKAKKSYYYVLVMTEGGAVFVTSVNNTTRYAHWKKDEKPMEFPAGVAEDLVFGLTINGNQAYLIKHPYEIESQPYNYKDWEIEWKKKEPEEKEA